MKKGKEGKLLEAALVIPITISVPGFALIYSKMWRPSLIFSLLLLASGYYAYSSMASDNLPIMGGSIFLSVHFLSLSYILVAKSKDQE
ncbi:hypothetical protein QEN58_17800 [Halomonas alkaliantarctica]|uniref:Group-specific protein n=1 Tax=Halomonas alkaliantarctica TaxID=232346 RepID=A0ABY8LP48_9GAMM|nr:hypothetical protein [Halomonas alkaliantarctica]WGI25164.1 hypothetical protein QEN58_17800 [Halomonas alkaliantarctica]